MNQILIVTHDVIGPNMAGPGIRCWEFARHLSREHSVTLATPYAPGLTSDAFTVTQYNLASLKTLAQAMDVIIVSGAILWWYPFLRQQPATLVVDIYGPFLLESLPQLSDFPPTERTRRHQETLDTLSDLLTWGDYFLCASERQRDYWLGWLNAFDRLNPWTYDADPEFRQLIEVVAFGVPDEPPQATRTVLKGVWPGIAATDKVVVWNGGVHNWLDPLTVIRAMAQVSAQRSDVKLLFMGIKIPDPGFDARDMAAHAVALSQELGLYNQTVFFNDWVPYQERQNYLLEADLAVSLHYDHLETRFAFRTRLLDCLWTGLPMIVTQGDVLADMTATEQLGWSVAFEDVAGVTDAILEGITIPRETFAPRFAVAAQRYQWSTVLQPLLEFCREPRQAPDRQQRHSSSEGLALLKLCSEINAQRRQIATLTAQNAHLENLARDHALKETALKESQDVISRLQAQNAELQATLEAVKQGRVMRLLNGLKHIFKGAALD